MRACLVRALRTWGQTESSRQKMARTLSHEARLWIAAFKRDHPALTDDELKMEWDKEANRRRQARSRARTKGDDPYKVAPLLTSGRSHHIYATTHDETSPTVAVPREGTRSGLRLAPELTLPADGAAHVSTGSGTQEPSQHARTTSVVWGRIRRRQKGHRYRRMVIRVMVWNRFIGEEVGRAQCVCCGVAYITQMRFHCGHVVPAAEGGPTTVENLRPICETCNLSMGTRNMCEFQRTHGFAPLVV